MHRIALSIFAVSALLMIAATARTRPGTHLDPDKNPGSCLACHKSHGKPSTAMMRDAPDKLCLTCHGPNGTSPAAQATEVYSLFQKRSKHPVLETAQYHRSNEVLPERNPSAARHVSCDDCHEPHTLRNDNKSGRVKGITYSGIHKVAEKDSEVCYKCHSESMNKKVASNIRLQFEPSNASAHPVERMSGKRGPSLVKNAAQGSTMGCSDCHEPHGSDYPPLLKKNYALTDGAESFFAYELCYSCHRRESILGNESFYGSASKQYGHREHIIFQRASCRACHSAHGSQGNGSLIAFDRTIVSGPGQYMPALKGAATCILICHGRNHGIVQRDMRPKIRGKQ
jgi:predicted CXXCH cytochrome family protein